MVRTLADLVPKITVDAIVSGIDGCVILTRGSVMLLPEMPPGMVPGPEQNWAMTGPMDPAFRRDI
ncbi:MAG: hypothetical protein EBZ36_00295 [Acidobacteria bacterium]|nr:hypothetical protein [Acidobacteriota bacterium]